MARKRIFISYSRSDSELVKPLAQLLKLGGRFVFLDVESIEPGKPWQDAIALGIRKSDYFVLLWCCHAAQSEQVAQEVQSAIGIVEYFLPILLCPIKVPPPIDRYQWVDLSAKLIHPCEDHSAMKTLPKQTVSAEQVLYLGTKLRSLEPFEVSMTWKRVNKLSLWRASVSSGVTMAIGLVLLELAIVKPFPGLFGPQGTLTVNIVTAVIGVLAAFAGWLRIGKLQKQRTSLMNVDGRSQLLGLTINCLLNITESGRKIESNHNWDA
jgi:hypothetical protein